MQLFNFIILSILFCLLGCNCSTTIEVVNHYKSELNIKIQGLGVGGCDLTLDSGASDQSSCWCLWGTLNYSFCAYKKSLSNGTEALSDADKTSSGEGKCPKMTGGSLLCSDLQSLGNCYKGAYQCSVDNLGLCHCDAT